MKSTCFRAVFCVVLGLVLLAMPGTTRGDNCDTEQETSREMNRTENRSADPSHRHDLSRDRESSPHRMQDARESAGIPDAGSPVTYSVE